MPGKKSFIAERPMSSGIALELLGLLRKVFLDIPDMFGLLIMKNS
jgi:hypothetical protein